ncbi:MAG: ATP-binding protein [Actinomycetota bacterium]|nr:ATP-binding protein [Actinomycetota bacterium]
MLGVVDQVAAAELSSSLPVIVSAAALALGVDQLCVHLLAGSEPPRLRRFAAVGLPETLLAANEELAVGPGGGPVGRAAESGSVVVEEDLRDGQPGAPSGALGQPGEVLSCWAVPIVANDGLLGVVSGYGASTGRPRADLVELVYLYAGYAATAIQRVRLVAEADALRRSHSLQRLFLSRVSHELRTPLTAIQGYASTLRQSDVTWDPESEDRFLGAIASESARMSRLVADLLDSSAIESGVLRLNPDWCDLPLVLRAALGCLSPEQAAAVDLSWDPALPPVWGDHDRLEQVFVNLMENGLRHTAPGTRVQLHAGLGRRPGTVAVRVADDGPGVPPEEAERLFRPWERGQTDGPGAGLGLSIVRGIVEGHRGAVGLEPSPRGASFLVELPIDPTEDIDPDGAAGRLTAVKELKGEPWPR